jgi:hypothetical protein
MDGLKYMGKNPQAGYYLCGAATMYAAPTAPLVCSAAAGATAVGKWVSTDASKKVFGHLAAKRCDVVVKAGEDVYEIAVVEGKAAAGELQRKVEEAKTTYTALSTPEGMAWLMRYLSRSH